MISRKVYAEVPPRVEYSVTELGRSIEPVLLELTRWAKTHMLPSTIKDSDAGLKN